jgi:tetratricopeptide (TPR) repeat protein
MARGWLFFLFALLSCLGFGGCYPNADSSLNEEKNPYFLEGKARVSARDYRGAIVAFEKALEENPRSALAHFELGVLYEQHGDQSESAYINALFHYQQAMRLRPNAYPCDNARLRMASCKRELVKAESLAPVYQSMQRDLERLKAENQQLRKLLEAWQALGGNRLPGALPIPPPAQDKPGSPSSAGAGTALNARAFPARAPANPSPAPLLSPAYTAPLTGALGAPAAMRTHVVRLGDTPTAIARQYRIKLESLLAANPGLNARRLRPGQTLRIPTQ